MKEKQKHNPKHNKELCWKCKYHTYMGNLGNDKTFEKMSDLEKSAIACYYSVMRNETCMKNVHGVLVESRGNDYDSCSKFEPEDEDDKKSRRSTYGKWVIT